MRWVLLRGWGREAAHWGDFPARLARAFPGAHIEAIDLPGNGERHGERSPASIAAMTQAVRAQAPRGEPAHVLALSMGAMVAIEWARLEPGEVAGLVLVNTSARPFAWPHERLKPASYARVLRAATMGHPAKREPHVLALTSRLRSEDRTLAGEWARIASDRPVARANLLRQLWAAARYRAPAVPPPVRVLVLSSARDGLVDPACSARLAKAWDVPHAAHPTAGHDLPLDDGDWIADRLRDWLRPS